jgi:peptidoglycan/LPS O-acetylase OafA/YrhL
LQRGGTTGGNTGAEASLQVGLQAVPRRLTARRLSITATALIGVSLILYKAVEDPARKVLRALFSRMEAAKSAQD